MRQLCTCDQLQQCLCCTHRQRCRGAERHGTPRHRVDTSGPQQRMSLKYKGVLFVHCTLPSTTRYRVHQPPKKREAKKQGLVRAQKQCNTRYTSRQINKKRKRRKGNGKKRKKEMRRAVSCHVVLAVLCVHSCDTGGMDGTPGTSCGCRPQECFAQCSAGPRQSVFMGPCTSAAAIGAPHHAFHFASPAWQHVHLRMCMCMCMSMSS